MNIRDRHRARIGNPNMRQVIAAAVIALALALGVLNALSRVLPQWSAPAAVIAVLVIMGAIQIALMKVMTARKILG